MPTKYQRILEEEGLEAARKYMQEIRKKVKNPGFASMDKQKHKEISRKGGQKRWRK